jgi:hypothetical protein
MTEPLVAELLADHMFPKLMMKKAMISCEEAFVQIG